MHPRSLDFAEAFESYKSVCAALIHDHDRHSLCEIGGGRGPLFSAEEIAAMGVEYTVLDVSEAELALAPPGVRRHRRDICAPVEPQEHGLYEFMFSKFLAEHVPDGRAFHRNVFAMLKPGGIAFHFYPTLFYPAFIGNRLLPHALTVRVMSRLFGYDRKFPALYSQTYGPTAHMKGLLGEIGYEIVEFRPFYGSFYFVKFPVIRGLERRFTDWAANKGNPYFSSYAFLVVRKPATAA
jgi:hypothetical protein